MFLVISSFLFVIGTKEIEIANCQLVPKVDCGNASEIQFNFIVE